MTEGDERTVLVDASTFITLAAIEGVGLLYGVRGSVAVPDAVVEEIRDEPAASALAAAERDDRIGRANPSTVEAVESAGRHLDVTDLDGYVGGDVPLLAYALESSAEVVITDDRPLRKACKALGVPVSGAIGVLVAAVERSDLEPDAAKSLLEAMDEVGARLSARLLRRAERLIDGAA